MAEAKALMKIQSSDHKLKDTYPEARNKYFSAIKQAKSEHWEDILANEDTTSIFKEKSYTRDGQVQKFPDIASPSKGNSLKKIFDGKCHALRTTLFPIPPSARYHNWTDYQSREWTWPQLTENKLRRACSARIKGKKPGLDSITQKMITHAYRAISTHFM